MNGTTRFETPRTPLMYLAIAVSLAGVFAGDLYYPLGIAVWVLYLVPVGFSYFAWRPAVPGIVALLATLLTIAGYFLSPQGGEPGAARLNRLFGGLSMWALAALGYEFIRNKLAVRREEWLETGQAKLADAMAGNPDLSLLGEKVLAFLCDYVGAAAGALFFEDAGAFRRTATYGVPADADIPQQFRRGDGLLGQVLVNRRMHRVQEIPDGYLTVGSALGRGKPSHLLIAPLQTDEAVTAVLEMGLFRPADAMEEEFIDRCAEAIAVAVRSARYREQVQELLEETQRQAEELQVQSEELRTNNEELEQQGRVLKDSQLRLEAQQVELEQTNAQLEEQARTLEMQKEELRSSKEVL